MRVDSRLAMTPLVWSVGLPPRGGRVSECAALDSDGDASGSRCCVPCHCSSVKLLYFTLLYCDPVELTYLIALQPQGG